jgi:2-polyprenyl-6-methoxyphenol hydroxylase-like FAD-dependent oxidoreductase
MGIQPALTTSINDLIVGADGINSTVRRLAVSPVPPQYADTVNWRSVIPARPPGTGHLMTFTGERCYFGLVPVGDGGTYGFAGLDGQRSDDPPAGPPGTAPAAVPGHRRPSPGRPRRPATRRPDPLRAD